jgi:anti-anti-sigma factor
MDRLVIHRVSLGAARFLRLDLSGELDSFNVSALCEAVVTALKEGDCHLRIDLANITWCDAASLYSLLGVRHAVGHAGGSFALTHISSVVRTELKRTGLDQILVVQQG